MKNPMTLPIENHEIDALVDGELAEQERQQLLLRLDDEPAQWRRVALAFLEAQAFRAAWQSSMTPPLCDIRPVVPVRQRSSLKAILVLAACLLLSFLTGLMLNRTGPAPIAAATVPVEPAEKLEPSPPPVRLSFTMHMPAELRQQLLRCGYEVLEQPKLIHIQQGGRSIPVYVNDLKVRFVGRREVL